MANEAYDRNYEVQQKAANTCDADMGGGDWTRKHEEFQKAKAEVQSSGMFNKIPRDVKWKLMDSMIQPHVDTINASAGEKRNKACQDAYYEMAGAIKTAKSKDSWHEAFAKMADGAKANEAQRKAAELSAAKARELAQEQAQARVKQAQTDQAAADRARNVMGFVLGVDPAKHKSI